MIAGAYWRAALSDIVALGQLGGMRTVRIQPPQANHIGAAMERPRKDDILRAAERETEDGTIKVALLDLATLKDPRLLNANPHISAGPQFTPDGKAVAYPVRENGVDNVWIQPLDGSPGHTITQFDAEQILSFHWSPDGKNLGVLRGHTDSDVVLLQESKP